MKPISDFIFEALFLKQIPRSGYQFLGAGRESVAEHVYAATLIAFVLSRLEPQADTERLLTLCLFHDLPEARIGDMNYVQKRYVQTDEKAALADALAPEVREWTLEASAPWSWLAPRRLPGPNLTRATRPRVMGMPSTALMTDCSR